MQNKFFDMIVKEDDVTWQGLITKLIKSEEMNPWDVDVSILVQRYIETVLKMKKMNFFVSGKVLLAASILLKVKSHKLVTEEIARFDEGLFAPMDEDLGGFEELKAYMDEYRAKNKIPGLAIKTPQSRKRNVTVTDLVAALKKALEVEQRREVKRMAVLDFLAPTIPKKKVDIKGLMDNVYSRIKSIFSNKNEVTFTSLLPGNTKEDKIYTFLPLFHLSNDSRIDLEQQEHFGEIYVKLK